MVREFTEVAFASAAEWDAWLEVNGGREPGIWILMAKKATGIPSVNWEQAVEVALCHGWIDGIRKALDEKYFRQKFTPRGARSTWSQRNCRLVEQLTEQGKMRAAGLRAVEAAKADGRWAAAYGSSRTAEMPPEWEAAMAAEPALREAFGKLTAADRFAAYYRLHTAKRPETRERRLRQLLENLRLGRPIRTAGG